MFQQLKPIQPMMANRTPRYREAAYHAIKEAILSGLSEPGQALIEEQLAAALHISRTPVREALAILEHEGLIAPAYGRGLYVRILTHEEFIAMFVANEAVEPFLVRQAALNATPEQIAAIEAIVNDGLRAVERGDIAGALRSGRDFHKLIGDASGNKPLTDFVLRNEERTDLFLLSYGKVIDADKLGASNREHAAIAQAVAKADPEAAQRLVIYHAQALRERLAPLFSESSELIPAAIPR